MRTDAACASLPCVFTLSKSRRTFVLRSVSPSGVAAISFSPHPVVSGRPAYIKASGTPSIPFFAAPRRRATRRRRSPPPISTPAKAGSGFYPGTAAPSIPFFETPKFFSGSRSVLPPLYFPLTWRILRRVSEGRFLPRCHPTVNPFFQSAGSLTPRHSGEAVAALRPPHPDRSVRSGGRFVRPATQPVKPFFIDP